MYKFQKLNQIQKIGIFFLLLNIIKCLVTYINNDPIYVLEFFWYCNIASFALSLAMIFYNDFKLSKVATLVFITALPSQIIWILAFILDLLNIYNLNRVELYNLILSENNLRGYLIYSFGIMEHFALIPLSIYIIYKKGFAADIQKYIFLSITLLLSISFVISPDNLNLNCIKHSCDVLINDKTYAYDFKYFFLSLIFWNSIITLCYLILTYIFRKVKI